MSGSASARCRPASPGRRRPRRRAADPAAVPVLELRQRPHGFRGDGDGGDGPAAVIVLRAGRRWPCVLATVLPAPCRGRGVPASPQRGGCSATGATNKGSRDRRLPRRGRLMRLWLRRGKHGTVSRRRDNLSFKHHGSRRRDHIPFTHPPRTRRAGTPWHGVGRWP